MKLENPGQYNNPSFTQGKKIKAGIAGLAMLCMSYLPVKAQEAQAKPAPESTSLTGARISNDGYGNITGELNFGTFYANKKIGFLTGLTVDFPKGGKLASNIKDNLYRIDDWGRMGVMLSIACLKGKPEHIIWGLETGIGIQSTHSNSRVENIGNMSIDEFLKKYVSNEESKERNSVFCKLGVLLMFPIEGKFYVVINAGVKGGIHPTEQGTSYNDVRVDLKNRVAPYVGLGLLVDLPWKIATLNQ